MSNSVDELWSDGRRVLDLYSTVIKDEMFGSNRPEKKRRDEHCMAACQMMKKTWDEQRKRLLFVQLMPLRFPEADLLLMNTWNGFRNQSGEEEELTWKTLVSDVCPLFTGQFRQTKMEMKLSLMSNTVRGLKEMERGWSLTSRCLRWNVESSIPSPLLSWISLLSSFIDHDTKTSTPISSTPCFVSKRRRKEFLPFCSTL